MKNVNCSGNCDIIFNEYMSLTLWGSRSPHRNFLEFKSSQNFGKFFKIDFYNKNIYVKNYLTTKNSQKKIWNIKISNKKKFLIENKTPKILFGKFRKKNRKPNFPQKHTSNYLDLQCHQI